MNRNYSLRAVYGASLALALAGCGKVEAAEGTAPTLAAAAIPQRASSGPLRMVSNGELTAGLQRRARDILEEHADAEVGASIPFRYGGRSYIARIEQHYNPEGGERKPWGWHKGVTLYTRDNGRPGPTAKR